MNKFALVITLRSFHSSKSLRFCTFWQERFYLNGDYDLIFFFRSLIFLQIKWKTIGFKMMPKSNSCASSILSYSRLKMMKTMRASKKAVKPMLFYKTLYFLRFYYCVNEIRTAYNFISCHYMYGISNKSNDIFNYSLKA